MIIATWNVFKGTTEARVSELKSTYDADIITFQETHRVNVVRRLEPLRVS